MPGVVTAALILLLAAPAAVAWPASDRCPGINDGKAQQVETDRFYAQRAVQIVEAGLSGDEEALDAAVAPGAEFIIWRRDYSRMRESRGNAGAIAFARDLEAKAFQLQSAQPGPIVWLVPDCAWSVTILFRTDDPAIGVSVKYKFRKGLLTSATGSEVAILEGNIGTSQAGDVHPGATE